MQQPDEYGESFYHRVNGIPFFAMGADYIPEDNILSRITADRTRWLLEQGKRCHFNAIRVWGGGIIEKEAAIDASNVMLYCPNCKQGVRVAVKVLENGEKVRVCKKCGETIGK